MATRSADPPAEALHQALIAECRRRLFEESVPRIKKCLALLDEEELWLRPNSETVGVGNLVLHLCGNVRQWLVSGLGGAADTRERAKEFSEAGPIPAPELLSKLDAVMAEARRVLDRLTPDDLVRSRPVQGFEETGVGILLHVVEHFSYHVGQISLFVKLRKEVDLQYYAGVDLGKTG